jgi:hypothetical protein
MATQDGSLIITASSTELDAVLEEGGDVASKIQEEVRSGALHRTQLWKYRTGRDRPGPDLMELFDRLSGGRIAATGWAKVSLPKKAQRQKRAAGAR